MMLHCRRTYSLAMEVAPRVLIEVAQQSDLDLILPLVQQFYSHFHYRFDLGEKQAQLGEFVATPALGRLLAIKSNGALVGYALIAFSYGLEFGGRVAFIDELFILPSARSLGVGSAALAQIETLCAECGIRALRLEVEDGNSKATPLYLRTEYSDHRRRLLTKALQRGATSQSEQAT